MSVIKKSSQIESFFYVIELLKLELLYLRYNQTPICLQTPAKMP